MAHITLNITTSPAPLALPHNARIVSNDTDTNTETADLVISGADSLIVSDETVQITATTTGGAASATAGGGDTEKVVADEKADTDDKIRTYDVNAKLYTKISSRSHNLKSYAVRRIVEYAATHDLSARLWVMLTEDAAKPYVGYLQPMTNDPDNTKFLFVDEKPKLGKVQIDLSKTDHDFVLEVYSDANMHCLIFAGTDHAGYDEVSVNQMASHIIATLDV